jgi:arylsulfatase A-like enzyme
VGSGFPTTFLLLFIGARRLQPAGSLKENPVRSLKAVPSMKGILGLILALAAVCGGQAAEAAKPGPNVLFLFTDDQRHDTIHALGNPHIKTPNLDRLAQNGFVFRNCYCMGSTVGAVCLPSRTMVMTGRSLYRLPKVQGEQAPADLALLPRAFKQAGYTTYRTGKKGNTCLYGNAAFDQNVYDDGRDAQSSERYADRVIAFLNQQPADKPFFAQIDFPHPHDPRNAPAEYLAMYEPARLPLPKNYLPEHPFDNGELKIRDEKLAAWPRTPEAMRRHLADYYATITCLDAQVGRILEALEKTGRAGNTIVVFSSDHGLAVGGMHGLMGKQNLYEHNKPPLIFHGRGIPKGQSDALVYLFDIFPTLCELADLKDPSSVDGLGLAPIIRGEKAREREWVFGAYRTGQRMIRDGRWKLLKYNAGGVRNRQLFDLASDPDEIKNLADDPKYRDQLERLEKLFAEGQRWAEDPVKDF